MVSLSSLITLCEDVRRCPSTKSVDALQKGLESLHTSFLDLRPLQDYVLLPLVQLLDTDSKIINNELKVQLLETISILLKNTRFHKRLPFDLINLIVLNLIYDPTRKCMRPSLSDELKLAAVQCIDQTYRALASDIRLEYYSKLRADDRIGHIVYVALLFIEQDRYHAIRMAALQLLSVVLYTHDGADMADLELRQLVADRVFIMLPKVSRVLLQAITVSDVKQPLKLRTYALDTLGKFLGIIFQDYQKVGDHVPEVPQATDFRRLFASTATIVVDDDVGDVLESTRKAITSNSQPLGAGHRSTAWLEAAIQRLCPVFMRLLQLSGTECHQTRRHLSTFASDLFILCPSNIQQHLEPVLRMLLVLGQDADDAIANECRQRLASLQGGGPNAAAFVDQMDALVHKVLVTCPRVMATGTEAEQIALIVLLTGVTTAARLKLVLAAGDAMDRFCTALLFMFELEDADGAALEALRETHQLALEFGNRDERLPSAAAAAATWRPYKRLRSKRIAAAAERLCRAVARSTAGEAVCAQLMVRMRDRTAGSNEALLVMQLMLAGGGWSEVDRCRALLDELMAGAEHWELDVRPSTVEQRRDEERPSDWYESRTPGLYESAITIRYTDMRYRSDDTDGDAVHAAHNNTTLTIAEAHQNVQHICLTLETIGRLAVSLKQQFQPYLLRSLYRILVRTGSGNDQIHAAGCGALHDIAVAFGHTTVAQLIGANFDYVLHSVTMALRRRAECAGAMDMLAVLLRYGPAEAVPQWQSIVQTVLEASGQRHGGDNVLGFLNLFHNLLGHLERLQPETVGGSVESESCGRDEEVLRAKWLEILNGSDPDLMDDFDSDGQNEAVDDGTSIADKMAALMSKENGTDDADNRTDGKPPPTVSVQITEAIMKRCIHYMPHKSRAAQCLALDTMRCGVRLLAHADYADILCPLVHSMWPAFVERVRGRDAVVLRRCFGLMLEMSGATKEFIYKRAAADIFPLILTFLKQAAIESRERVHETSFDHSQTHQLVIELFAALPALVQHLSVAESDLDAMLNAALPFLHRHHHRPAMQRSAREFFQSMSAFDAGAVWLKLSQSLRCADTAANVRVILSATELAFGVNAI